MEELLDKEMDLVGTEDLEMLCRDREGPCVSLFLPTHREWSKKNHDIIRFKTLLGKVAEKLEKMDAGVSVDGFLTESRDLLEGNTRFWRHQADGLAIFMAPGEFHSFRLPVSLGEHISIGKTFHLRPLISLLNGSGRFHVLALSMGGVKLYSGSKYRLGERALEDVPTSLKDALKYDVYQSLQQFHSGVARSNKGGNRGAMFHGQGDAADKAQVKKQMREFLRKVDNGVRDVLSESQDPLLLVGLDHLRGAYREVNHYKYMADGGIAVNPDDLSNEDLHSRAWSYIAPQFEQDRKQAVETLRKLRGNDSDRVSTDIEKIVSGAYFKRVDTLFVREGSSVRGNVSTDASTVTVIDSDEAGDDLLDLATAHACRNGGSIYVDGDDVIPGNAPAAAIFRF